MDYRLPGGSSFGNNNSFFPSNSSLSSSSEAFLPFPEKHESSSSSHNGAHAASIPAYGQHHFVAPSTHVSVAPLHSAVANISSQSASLNVAPNVARSPQTAALLERIAKLQERLGERTMTPIRETSSNGTSARVPNLPLAGRHYMSVAQNFAATSGSTDAGTVLTSTADEKASAGNGDQSGGARPRLQASLVGRLLADLHYKDEEIRRLGDKLKLRESHDLGESRDSASGPGTHRKLEFGTAENVPSSERVSGGEEEEVVVLRQQLTDAVLQCDTLKFELKMSAEREKEAIESSWHAHQQLQIASVERNGVILSIKESLSRAIDECDGPEDSTAVALKKELNRVQEIKLVTQAPSPVSFPVPGSTEQEHTRAADLDRREMILDQRQRELENFIAAASAVQIQSIGVSGGNTNAAALKILEQRVSTQEKAILTLETALAEARRAAAKLQQQQSPFYGHDGPPSTLLSMLAEAEDGVVNLREEIIARVASETADAAAKGREGDEQAEESGDYLELTAAIANAASEFAEMMRLREARANAIEKSTQRLYKDLEKVSSAVAGNAGPEETSRIELTAKTAMVAMHAKIVALAATVGLTLCPSMAKHVTSNNESPVPSLPHPSTLTSPGSDWLEIPSVLEPSPQPVAPSPAPAPAPLPPKAHKATAPVTAARIEQLEAALRERDAEIDALKSSLSAGSRGGKSDEVLALRERVSILQTQLDRHLEPGRGEAWGDTSLSKYSEPDDDIVDEIDIHELTVGQKIGQGSFAGVFKGTWHRSVAVKMFKTVVNQNQIDAFSREAKILRSMRHRSVCRFMGTCTVLPDMYIVMELINGRSLHNVLHDGQSEDEETPLSPDRLVSLSDTLSLQEILGISMQIAQAMCYLHANNVIHRDLKPTNLIVDEYGAVKLIDFGLAFAGDPRVIPENKILAGTPVYLPPEVLREERCSSAMDVFSFAIILWEMCTAELPWRGVECDDMIHRVTVLDERPPIAKDFPPGLAELIRSCWHRDPAQRPTFPAITRKLHALGAPPTPPRPVASFETIQAM